MRLSRWTRNSPGPRPRFADSPAGSPVPTPRGADSWDGGSAVHPWKSSRGSGHTTPLSVTHGRPNSTLQTRHGNRPPTNSRCWSDRWLQAGPTSRRHTRPPSMPPPTHGSPKSTPSTRGTPTGWPRHIAIWRQRTPPPRGNETTPSAMPRVRRHTWPSSWRPKRRTSHGGPGGATRWSPLAPPPMRPPKAWTGNSQVARCFSPTMPAYRARPMPEWRKSRPRSRCCAGS